MSVRLKRKKGGGEHNEIKERMKLNHSASSAYQWMISGKWRFKASSKRKSAILWYFSLREAGRGNPKVWTPQSYQLCRSSVGRNIPKIVHTPILATPYSWLQCLKFGYPSLVVKKKVQQLEGAYEVWRIMRELRVPRSSILGYLPLYRQTKLSVC